MTFLSIVPLPTWPSIPDLLRELADGMEDGTYVHPDSMVYIMESEGGFHTGIMGRTSPAHACGMLTIGAQFMAQEATE